MAESMTYEQWNRVRSEFNHGWLRNQVIMSLYRVERCLSGAVTDEGCEAQLGECLRQWSVRRFEIQPILSYYRADWKMEEETIWKALDSRLDPSKLEFLQTASAFARNFSKEGSGLVAKASAVCQDFDRGVDEVLRLLSTHSLTLESVVEFRLVASNLADTLGSVGLKAA